MVAKDLPGLLPMRAMSGATKSHPQLVPSHCFGSWALGARC